MIFSTSFKQNFLKLNESCFLDGKKPNIAKLVYINFLTDSMKIAMLYSLFENSRKSGFFLQILKKNTRIRVFLHAEFISALKTEPKPKAFEK